ncbi:MAG: polysaccharide biosynthesis protein [Hymenobacter sp.]|nr:MAG: polysaccharide biosynthesis protein [Hymenobacter sp.]
MRILVRRAYNSFNLDETIAWVKLISITGASQVFIQGLSFIGGILVIRSLPTKEYALYTLANTMLGTMSVLADGGITTGVLAQGGKVWQDKERLGIVLATGLNLRMKLALLSLLISMPILLYLLHHHGASWAMILLITAALIPAFFTSLSGSMLEVTPRLLQQIVPLQKIQIGSNLGRLTLLVISVFTFPLAFIAILAAGVPQIWANIKLRKLSMQFADDRQKPDADVRRQILAMVKRLLPESIYYCISGQITIWLISVLGSTTSIAQVGALGRFTMIFAVISTLMSALFYPRFARLPNDSRLLFKRYLQIQAVVVIISSAVIFAVWLLSDKLLFLLGGKYAGLSNEVVLLIIGGGINFISGSSFYMCTSRGWVINPIITIVISIASMSLGIIFLDISSLHGILIFNILVGIPTLLMHVIYGVKRILSVE